MASSVIRSCYSNSRIFMQNPESSAPTKKGLAVTIGCIAAGAIATVLGTLMLLAALHQLPQGLASLSPLGAFSGSIGVGRALCAVGGVLFIGGGALALALTISYFTHKHQKCPPCPEIETPPLSQHFEQVSQIEIPKTFLKPSKDTNTTNLEEVPLEILPCLSQLFWYEYGALDATDMQPPGSKILFGGGSSPTGQIQGWAFFVPADKLENYIKTNLPNMWEVSFTDLKDRLSTIST